LRINLIRTSKDVVSHIIPALHIRAAVFFSAHQQRRIDLNSPSAESRRFANGASRCSHLNVENKGDRRNELGLRVPETARRIDPAVFRFENGCILTRSSRQLSTRCLFATL
jgi:hypothetical protein